jgi:hypothetical protein
MGIGHAVDLRCRYQRFLVHNGDRCLDGLNVRKERFYVYPYIAWNKPDSEYAYTSEWGCSVLVDSETRTSMLSLWNHRRGRETMDDGRTSVIRNHH